MDDDLLIFFAEPFEACLEEPAFRASFVHFLITRKRFDQAVEMAVPLLGTGEDSWYLFARSWQALGQGDFDTALRLHAEAQELASVINWFDFQASFLFDDEGYPLPIFPFVSPFDFPDGHEPFLFEGTFVAELAELLREGEWPAILLRHRQTRPQSESLVADLAFWIEQVLHLDFHSARSALKGMSLFTVDRDDGLRYLTVLFSCDENMEAAIEVFWRLNVDWGYPQAITEVVAYLYYLLGNDDLALETAEAGLKRHPVSVICGNIRALLLSERGLWYAADEQWRETMRLAPDRGATHLVLGWQALSLHQDDIATRYFLEAAHIGDNHYAAGKSLEMVYRCLQYDSEDLRP